MPHLDTTISLLGELIAHPTISCDSNLQMMAVLAGRLDDLGARLELETDESGNKANLFATLGPEGDGGLVLCGHSDVVPVAGQDWSHDPFDMQQRDGKLYGRGTCDMKGFIAAAMAMAGQVEPARLKRPLHLAFTYDEEIGCLGARALAQSLQQRGLRPAMALVGEPTSMRVIEGHKGCCEYTTRFHGLAGHGSMPDKGVNAVEYAVRYVARLLELRDDLKGRAPADSRFEPKWTTINTGAIHGGSAHNVIAETASVDWEMRPVQDSDRKFVKSRMGEHVDQVLLPAMRAVSPGASITTEVMGEVAGLEPASDNEIRDILMVLTGANDADVVPFGTEAGIYRQLGMSVVVCGPGSIEQAHKGDEFVEIDQLSRCLAVLEKLLADMQE